MKAFKFQKIDNLMNINSLMKCWNNQMKFIQVLIKVGHLIYWKISFFTIILLCISNKLFMDL
jgi:hypothetical protein